MIQVTTWMNLENTLAERNREQKATYCMILFIWNVQNSEIKSKETKSRLISAQGQSDEDGGEWWVSTNGYRVSFKRTKCSKTEICDDGCTTLWIY